MIIMIWLIFSAITFGLGLALAFEAGRIATVAGHVPSRKPSFVEKSINTLKLLILCYCPLLNLYVFYLFIFRYDTLINEIVKQIKERCKECE